VKDPKPLRWDAELTVAANSRSQLPAALQRYLKFGDEMLSRDVHPRELHRLRLATKHIRYSVEVFAGLFGPRIQELLKILRETQQRLGAISDATATEAWLKKRTLSRDPEVVRLTAYLEERASNQANAFPGFWQKHFGDPAERERWLIYLQRYAGRSPARTRTKPALRVQPPETAEQIENTASLQPAELDEN
jgi:CHAD domain